MGYTKEIYDRALNVKLDRIKSKKRIFDAGVEKLRETSEEFRAAELALMQAGSKIALTAISGDEGELERLKEICLKQCEIKNALLKKAGLVKPEVECPLCDDEGFKGGKLCGCVQSIAKKLSEEALSSSLPMGNCRFDNFDLEYYSENAEADGSVPRKRASAILALCKDFAENFSSDRRSLLFMGGAGLGKTHLSLAIVSELTAKGYGVVYGSAQNLFAAAEKEHFTYGGETEIYDNLLNTDLLVIDDLGTEFYSPFTASLFYNIVNSRILNRKPTVISTNLSFDELEKKYTPRITSRFIGNYDMKKFIGNDIRQIKAISGR